MDRLTATRVFVEVAERGSLTQAAERLEMSPAMVSRYLAAMEGWLGTRLLHRTTRRVSLTEAGQEVLSSCRQLLEMERDVQHLAGNRRREPEGKVRIAASPSFTEAWLTSAIVDFQQRHPGVEVELLVADRTVGLVEERIDLAIRISNALDPALVARPLTVCRSALCAAPGYLARHGQPTGIEELKTHRFVTHAFGNEARYRLRHAGETLEVPVQGMLHTNETAILRRAVLAGAGIGMLPTYYVGDDLRSGVLVRVLPDHEPEPLGIHAVYLSRRHQPLALRLLVEFLSQHLAGEIAPWDRELSPP